MILKVTELLIIVLFDGGHLFSHVAQLTDLVLHLFLKERHFVLKIINSELFKHDYLVIAMVPKKTLEADGA